MEQQLMPEESKSYKPNRSVKSNEYRSGDWIYNNLEVDKFVELHKSDPKGVLIRLLRLNNYNDTDKKYKMQKRDTGFVIIRIS